MKKAAKRVLIATCCVALLAFVGVYLTVSCPSLWAKEFPIDPGVNAHLASLTLDSPQDAAYEAIYWNVPDSERVAGAKVEAVITPLGVDRFKAVTAKPMQDDSYHMMYHEMTLTRINGVWSVLHHRKCWAGRGLVGWSTGIPS